MFCCTLLYIYSSIAIILMGKRELIALLNLSSWCLVMVERLFLAMPRGCLQFVIVVFPDHTHLLFFIYGLLPSISRLSLNTDLVRHPIIKMADKMAATYQYPLSWSLIFNHISSKLHIWIASINLSFKFEYGFCSTSDNQDDRRNSRRLSISDER